MLTTTGVHELDRQTVTAESTRVSLLETAGSNVLFRRTIWYCFHLFNKAFDMHLTGFLLRATETD